MINAKTKKSEVLKSARDCKCCGHCCSYGSGYLLDEEIPEIAEKLGLKEEEFKQKYLEPGQRFNTRLFRFKIMKKPYGPCIFLKDNKCSINEFKPLYCRIGNCNEHGEALIQWFNVNFFLNLDDPVSVREYAIYCELNKLIPGAHITELVQKDKLDKIMDYYELRRPSEIKDFWGHPKNNLEAD